MVNLSYQMTFFLYIPKPFYTIHNTENLIFFLKCGIIKVSQGYWCVLESKSTNAVVFTIFRTAFRRKSMFSKIRSLTLVLILYLAVYSVEVQIGSINLPIQICVLAAILIIFIDDQNEYLVNMLAGVAFILLTRNFFQTPIFGFEFWGHQSACQLACFGLLKSIVSVLKEKE